MKFSLFALPALSLMAWAAPTSVENTAVEKRQAPAGTLEDWLLTLNEELKPFTSHMTQVTSALPNDASDADKEAAAQSIMGDIAGIRQAFRDTTAKVEAVRAQQQKRQTLADIPSVLGQLDGRPIILANLLLPIIVQLNPALGSVLSTLSLNAVYIALQPFLTTELPALILGLSGLVSGLLTALAPLLASLGGILAPIVAALL
ncbi:hypothetical protein CERZMDRAFT_107819 [Cercospora zeae-maydis SCOH1-5]|uniref:Uncharacterized protein n=1 Tax=Cercospora zeae-maydis SCOH1-5 TaxID=717836 RepID=A0A6A6EYB3_9PEZI|nr:hypothetical protein CERZMDRAFT_107819 [Cercospora zeae-maydis SCOH1-5]